VHSRIVITMRSLIMVLVVGCGSSAPTTDIAPTLRFADRSDAEINALVCGAATNDLLVAYVMLHQFETSDDPCPGVQGNTPTGGCTTANGTAITGSVTVSHDGTRFDALTLTNSFVAETWNGSFGGHDLTVERAGISVREDLNYTCVDLVDCEEANVCHSMCTAESSGVELVGVGGALVTGTWYYEARSEAHLVAPTLELVGEDTLTVDGPGAMGMWKVGSRTGSFLCQSPAALY
jgi:hypothetical protein